MCLAKTSGTTGLSQESIGRGLEPPTGWNGSIRNSRGEVE